MAKRPSNFRPFKKLRVNSHEFSYEGCDNGWWAFCLAVFVISCLALLSLIYTLKLSSVTSHIIIIDGGSTGTRLYVYSWRPAADPSHSFPKLDLIPPEAASKKVPRRTGIRAYNRVETLPGLDKYAGDPDKLKEASLGPLLDWARAVIPRKQWKATPVFLFATAGVRKLNRAARDEVMEAVRDVLEDSGLRFEREWAKTMSGEEEGRFGWVAINYANKKLQSVDADSPSPKPAPTVHIASHQSTLGVLDMGGSSVEVTHQVAPEERVIDGIQQVAIAGQAYKLHTHTYRHLGMNDAFDRSVTILLEQASKGDNGSSSGLPHVDHPCLHSGYNKSYTMLGIGDSDSPSRVHKCKLIGKPDWEHCNKLVAEVLNVSNGCSPPCGLDGSQAEILKEVAALNGFYVVWKFFGLDPTSSTRDLDHKGKEFCNRPWDNVEKKMGEIVQVDRYCFRAPFISKLLDKGLGVEPGHLKVSSDKIGWTLGAALVEGFSTFQKETDDSPTSSYPPPPQPIPQSPSHSVFTVGFAVKILCASFGVVSIVYLCFRVRSQANRMQPDDVKNSILPVVIDTGTEMVKGTCGDVEPNFRAAYPVHDQFGRGPKRRAMSVGDNLSDLK